jgi:HAE1 family hydrophobic/amphiphilic exporter-1
MLEKFGDEIRYTFTQVNSPNSGVIMARLKNKSKMLGLWKNFEAEFANTPELQYWVQPWNPSELQIPNPPDFQVSIHGQNPAERIGAAREVLDSLRESQAFPRVMSEPDVSVVSGVELLPSAEQWALLTAKGKLSPADVADVSRVATLGRRLWQMPIAGEIVPIEITFPLLNIGSVKDLESMPIGVNGHLVPLKALAQVHRFSAQPDPYRENGSDMVLIKARVNKGDEASIPAAKLKAQALVEQWQKDHSGKTAAVVTVDDADFELTDALHQLAVAVGLSVLLIFITMVFQFGDVVSALLVLVAVPLGFIGVLMSLFVFQSTLSLNSVLGVILLNGIAVANSIILVDFLKRLVDSGKAPRAAACEAAKARLRPIFMTSLTTGLGMLPVALGLGEGGRILQPLGIAVIGGLSFSMLTTLFLVPALQVAYLEWRQSRRVSAVVPAPAVKSDWVEGPRS